MPSDDRMSTSALSVHTESLTSSTVIEPMQEEQKAQEVQTSKSGNSESFSSLYGHSVLTVSGQNTSWRINLTR